MMKKFTLITALIAMAFSVNAQQLVVNQAKNVSSHTMQRAPMADGEIQLGYSGEGVTYFGLGAEYMFRPLIHLSAETLAQFEGAQISKLRIYIGEYYSDNKIKIVFLKSLDDAEPFYTQDATVTPLSFNEFTLTEPYTIGNEGVYIGYEVLASETDYPIAVDAGPGNTDGDILGILEGGVWAYLNVSFIGYGNNCISAILTGDNLPKYDLTLQEIHFRDLVKTGTANDLSGSVFNAASKTINSYDVTYQIDDQAPVVKTINTPIAPSESAIFKIEGIKFDQDGTYNITVTVSNLDGNTDENESDNTLSKEVTASSETFVRKVLIENFSTALCGNCPAVHDALKNITAIRDDYAWVVHHAGFYTDDYTISESESYMWFYEPYGGSFAPALMFDRTNLSRQQTHLNTSTPLLVPGYEDGIKELLDYCAGQAALVSVDINSAYNEQTRELSVKVSGSTIEDFSRETYINIFLTEDGLYGEQSGGGSNYEHSHVLRKVMTDVWGDELTISDKKYEATYTTILSEDWNPENMKVIAFVSQNHETDYNDNKVLNTNVVTLINNGAGINDIAVNNTNVWTNGNNICIDGDYNEAAVYSIDGRLVTVANNAEIINVTNKGIYVVVVDDTTYKVVVK